MIDRVALLADLQKLLQRLEADLLERSESAEVPEVGATLRAEYDRAKTAERTAQNYEDWRTDTITQAAAAWVLSSVFVRFLEDNRLIDPPKMAGSADRLERARDEHELYFKSHPKQTDRDYLLAVFDQLAKLPGTKDVFGEHNPIRELPNWLSGDAAGELLQFFQKIDANTGTLVHEFTDPNWDTRFLGDLYQDLSEAAREKYALLQTPDFIEEFILDRTLNPALDEFGLDAGPILDKDGESLTEVGFRMIDPACGSGHFLLGAFSRILDRWQRKEPGTNVRELVQRTLDSIHGVDVNPYAVAIARFRLLLAAMRACGVTRLTDAPGFRLNIACGDSLLHAPLRSGQQVFDFELTNSDVECEHTYQSEQLSLLKRMLRGGLYHAVVANPPYIAPKDSQLNRRYRLRFASCHGQYSLAAPFMEQLFRLGAMAGYVGQITANSFMNNEYGRKLVEEFLPKIDLTHVVDTRYLQPPGHATPTVILFGRANRPVSTSVRLVMGVKGESPSPTSLPLGRVWSAITRWIDCPGSADDYISVVDIERELLCRHPWSIGGGGAAELKARLDSVGCLKLGPLTTAIGRTTHTGKDPAFVLDNRPDRTRGWSHYTVTFVTGEDIREFSIQPTSVVLFPYDQRSATPIDDFPDSLSRHFWINRTTLKTRRDYGETIEERGLRWFDHSMFFPARYLARKSIVFAFKATHNHFVIDRGGKVFNRHAPAIILKHDATDDTFFGLFAILNSSVTALWEREVHRQVTGAGEERWEVRLERNATKLEAFPLPERFPIEIGRHLDKLSLQMNENSPSAVIVRWHSEPGQSLQQCLDDAFIVTTLIQGEMRLVQEDLDWECYRHYGLIDEDLTVRLSPDDEDRCIPPGNRAFEIVLARKMAAGEAQSTWFERHGMTPNTELPDPAYNAKYREIVARRIYVIESNPEIALIEQPEYKRRWNWEPWESQKDRALRDWLLNRLESYFDFDGRMNDRNEPTAEIDVSLISVAKLADIADHDPEFHQVGAALQGDLAFDIPRLVTDLVRAECVPLLPILRYLPSGRRKRDEWERTWELQRREDAGHDVGEITPPPEYAGSDFISTGGARYWDLRGKLDVPKERWISFPHCDGPDGTLVICWAGYDHLQQARAISAYYVRVQTEFGGSDDPRLIPLLACLIELLPWLKQWHNDPDPAFDGMRMGDYFEGFITEEARQLGKTLPEIKAWTPPARPSGRVRRRNTT